MDANAGAMFASMMLTLVPITLNSAGEDVGDACVCEDVVGNAMLCADARGNSSTGC